MRLTKRAPGGWQRGDEAMPDHCQHRTNARPTGLAGRMPTVPVSVRLNPEQLETANRLASKLGIRLETVLKRVLTDGLRSLERANRLKYWS